VAATRLAGRDLDRFERAGADFHRRVVDGFRALAAEDPHRWITIRPDGDKDAVADRIRHEVTARLGAAVQP
jgi:dTMP kinase